MLWHRHHFVNFRNLFYFFNKQVERFVSNSKEFNQQLLNKVREFQGWQGINVDGIAGQQTLRHLERLSQPDAPSLTIEGPDNV